MSRELHFAHVFICVIFLTKIALTVSYFQPQRVSDTKHQTFSKLKNIDSDYSGGCASPPDVPINGNLSCSSESDCRAVCMESHRFPNGEQELAIICREQEWKILGADYILIPHCEPICLPECQNKGICIGPNQCNCPENFSGPQCQFENKPCLNLPPLITNAQRKCNSKTCTITCLHHFVFPDGSSVANLKCKHGNWEPTRSDWVSVPDCQPVCDPPCQNEGICLSLDMCQCPKDFRGPQCQYREDACSDEKLGFNGAYHCSSLDEHSYGCELSCPDGLIFEYQPAQMYVCRYEYGTYQPQPVPRCLDPIHGDAQTSYQRISNYSWTMHESNGYDASQLNSLLMGFSGSYADATANSQADGGNSASSSSSSSASSSSYGDGSSSSSSSSSSYGGGSSSASSSSSSYGFGGGVGGGFGNYGYDNSNYGDASSNNYNNFNFYPNGNGGSDTERIDTLNGGINGNFIKQQLDSYVDRRPEPGSCFTWAGTHYKTFDGRIYSFESSCAYTLLKEARDGLFTVSVQNDPKCRSGSSFCRRIICMYVQGKEYTLSVGESGLPEFRSAGKLLPIPTQLAHLRVEPASGGQALVAYLDPVGLTIRWDGATMLQLEAAESLWNRTAGLCGTLNGLREDDFGPGPVSNIKHLANEWKINGIGEKCEESPNYEHSCTSNFEKTNEAKKFCAKLLSDSRYKSCDKLINPAEFESTCQWDYCSCGEDDRKKCACETMAVYVRQCAHKGIVSVSAWRDTNVCPMRCTDGKIYMACGPKIQASCGADHANQEDISASEATDCEEGCFCPSGTVLHEGHCVIPEECPCRLRGKSFTPGSSVPKECNTCVCTSGRWICTEAKCAARCSAVGDPHYTTFDGKRYDFMGKCSYYLIKGDDYCVEAENAACTSAISQIMGFEPTFQDGDPSCTKTVTIRLNDTAIKLKQNRQILVNGEDVTTLPTFAGGAKIRIVSSIFIRVDLPNGIDILWDGVSRVYINAPAGYRGNTKGLCGTFTSNQKDDFLTPDGDVEQTVAAFANKWKTKEQCEDVKRESDHPCDLNPQKRSAAEKYCSVLNKKLFLNCHWHADPEPFYKDCLYDMCACESNVERCLCPTLSAYSKECAQLGAVVAWRQEVPECRIHCPGDQEYQMCGNSCTRSCADISFHHNCNEECVEGCNCPEGYTLDVNGECIPIGQCPCTYAGLEFLAGYREARPGTKSQELCTCAGGIWNCRAATTEEIQRYPAINQLKSVCSAIKHLEVTTCEPEEPRTCRNMRRAVDQTPAICHPGCVCKPGYVLDAPSGECVEESKCPCYHGGRSYNEGAVMQEECNTCRCSAGKWNCTDIVCPGVCSVWGDSHFKTFDDRPFDFQGVCDYVLAKGKLSEDESFEVTIRNVACGTTGVTCSKSLSLTVGKTNSANQESVTLTRGKRSTVETFKDLGRIVPRRAGLFVFLDVPDLGLVVQWDEGTRVYVRVDPKWKSHTRGLCGDYNDDAADDFKTPAGGIAEASAELFGDSWKLSELCAEPADARVDTCTLRPERKLWALQRCRIIKSSAFEACHLELAPDTYIERCLYDACGCDEGGDCECLCTAIAAYAHDCNTRGVPVQWRSQKLCPLQCDESCSSYSPCVSTCPRETCDNLATRDDSLHLCEQDTCIEGCLPKPCPEGQVYRNGSYGECVPRLECKTPCATINGLDFFEGDKVRGDECHSCFCSRGKLVCNGEPCAVPLPTATIPNIVPTPENKQMNEEAKKCTSGWTKWLNRDLPKDQGFRSEIEELPSVVEMLNDEGSPICEKEKMVDIQCRTTDTKISYKQVGLNVECSLSNGLLCEPSIQTNQTCPDFEISVLCQCENEFTPTIVDICQLDEPYRIAPTNCHDFLQCGPGLNGNQWVNKTCGQDMMFNAKLQICDWPTNVAVLRPECAVRDIVDITNNTNEIDNGHDWKASCLPGEYWHECAIECNRTCEYFNHVLKMEGTCSKNIDCIPGCVPNTRVECQSNNYLWRDRLTCVDRSHCVCKSSDGEPVSPGTMIKVSQCKVCQCINNFYACDESNCQTNDVDTIDVVTVTNITRINGTKETIIIPHVLTPPKDCKEENLMWLIESVPIEVTFVASSSASPDFSPDSARLVRLESTGSWRPMIDNENQWIEVIFKSPKPMYGVIVKGDIVQDMFVTSYNVLFSENGQAFSYVTNIGQGQVPRVFRGPVESSTPVSQIFHPPIEAKVVRFNPLTWHKGIAMQIEIIGCGSEEDARVEKTTTTEATITTTVASITPAPIITTTVITETIIEPVCDDKMGYDDRLMSDQQVLVSSSSRNNIPNLRLSSFEAWRPQLDNPDQYVQFDFLEPRNLTGVETKGGNDTWTTAYKVRYSIDGKTWNPVMDDTGTEREYLGNVDDHSSKMNYFKRPLRAKLLRIFPTKWHRHIGLKVEIHGCYEPYPTIEATTPVPSPMPSDCNVCNGIMSDEAQNCRCEGSLWWDGKFCVTKQECPCIVGHVPYPVGSSYETPDCQHCLCTLGGNSVCQPKICPACSEPTSRPVLVELCTCICKPCPSGQLLCSTSDTCIDEAKWCDGVQDCPDDETGCSLIASTNTTIDKETTISIKCHTACPPGFVAVEETDINHSDFTNSYSNFSFSIQNTQSIKYTQQIYKEKLKSKLPPANPIQSRLGGSDLSDLLCPKLLCIPTDREQNDAGGPCRKIECPEGFQPKYDQSKSYRKTSECDNTCVPIPSKERFCKNVGRTFATFDNFKYKYDICNHILARDRDANNWYIVMEKVCENDEDTCEKKLLISVDGHTVVLHTDMCVEVDGNQYSSSEVKRLSDTNNWMKLSRVGEALRFESRHYPFWVLLDSFDCLKISISEELSEHVDGLCGYLDGLSENDQQMPDGKLAQSTQEFGDSWKLLDSPECKLEVCPRESHKESWKICSLVKDATFEICDKVLDREKFTSSCLESSCACLGNSTTQDCRCKALASFVTDCLAADRSIDLSTWRSIYECPAVCDAPLVHKDCFRNKCEMSCENLRKINPCPASEGLCVSGCFCPDGLVQSGDDCVPPTECRDCACDGFGNARYITFDKSDVLFDGNCTYVLSRDVVVTGDSKHAYEVLVSNEVCDLGICTEAITVIYQEHIVQIRKENSLHELVSIVDNQVIISYPYKDSWIYVEKTPTHDIKLLIIEIQLELISYEHTFAFMLRLPSHTFGGIMEGLCGNCNGIQEDDFKKQDGQTTKNVQEFGKSWQAQNLPSELNLNDEHCASSPKKNCTEGPTPNNHCEKILQDEAFLRCHYIVDPTPYYLACKDTICRDGNTCNDFESYARMCSLSGICISWRTMDLCPYQCPPYLEYRACNPGCPENCETLEKVGPVKCTANPVEGCFCSPDYIWHNDTCVPKRDCFVCDDEGHIEGDVWQKDKCTHCFCEKKVVKCQETTCPAVGTICDVNSNPIVVPNTEEDCCQKYLCVPNITPTSICVETQQPECGFAQILKATVDSNGCQKFMCQCIPEEECLLQDSDFTTNDLILEPGYVTVTNVSGCCPRTTRVCKPETCPRDLNCQQYYVPVTKTNPNSCCPETVCEPPNDLCLYNMYSTNELSFAPILVAKKIGETWEDGKCKICSCEFKEGTPTFSCTIKECINIDNHPDTYDYVLNEVQLDEQCCPNFERVACKYADLIYQIGDKWYPNPNDMCTIKECSIDTNGVAQKMIIQDCVETCDFGYEYRPSLDKSVTCCGECVAIGCVYDGQLKAPGEIWYSDDHCLMSSCISSNGSLHTQISTETCVTIDASEENNYKIEMQKVYGKCCLEIIRTACSSNGKFYEPGETWKSPTDDCILESCLKTDDGNIIKQVETKTCNTDCPKGWIYQKSEYGNCCGECKQIYCVNDDMLFEPGKMWYSDDNCTSYSCIQQQDQLVISTSLPVCPELNCLQEFMYFDGCCKRCNFTNDNKVIEQPCAAEVIEFEKTIGLLVENNVVHGICKNFEPINGLTECHGHCNSSTYFNTENWNQIVNCKCCKPLDNKEISVQLICEDGEKFRKVLNVPAKCSCESCSSVY